MPGWLSSAVAPGGFFVSRGTSLGCSFGWAVPLPCCYCLLEFCTSCCPPGGGPHRMGSAGLGASVSPVSPPLRIRHGRVCSGLSCTTLDLVPRSLVACIPVFLARSVLAGERLVPLSPLPWTWLGCDLGIVVCALFGHCGGLLGSPWVASGPSDASVWIRPLPLSSSMSSWIRSGGSWSDSAPHLGTVSSGEGCFLSLLYQ